jgi:Family of unknown function (DUF6159)
VGSWTQSRTVTKQTWGIIKENPYMLLFPVVAGVVGLIAVLIVAGAGLAILGVSTVERTVSKAAEQGTQALENRSAIIGIIVLIVAAYVGTLITQIAMGGLVHCADEELQGRDSSFGAGIGAAFRRLPALMGWAAIQTLVGWLLSLLRGNGGDNIVLSIVRLVLASLAAVAWSVISFFVLPMIMLRGKGPIAGIKESVKLIRATWGMQIAGGLRIGGLIFLLAVLPGIVALIGGVFLMVADSLALGVPIATIGVIVIMLAQVLVSALRAVFSVALLHFAEDGQGLGPYAVQDLQSAVRVKAGR